MREGRVYSECRLDVSVTCAAQDLSFSWKTRLPRAGPVVLINEWTKINIRTTPKCSERQNQRSIYVLRQNVVKGKIKDDVTTRRWFYILVRKFNSLGAMEAAARQATTCYPLHINRVLFDQALYNKDVQYRNSGGSHKSCRQVGVG